MSFTGKVARLFRALSGKKSTKTAAVILAAGLSTRMQSENQIKKQFVSVDGIPVFVRSLLAFDACEYIDELILVIGKDDLDQTKKALRKYTLKKPFRLIYGGESRQESARKGFEAISPDADYVAVHDAARCLVTPAMIADVVTAAYANRAASASCASTDTLKRVNSNGMVTETIDRSEIVRAQTPQVFSCKLYRVATYVAREKGQTVTDDNMMVELLGQTVKMVDCGPENIKITTREDVYFAKAILQMRKDKQ